MKFTIDRAQFATAVNQAQRACGNDTSRSLHGVKLTLQGKRLLVTGTNLDTTITSSAPVEDTTDGVTLAPGALLSSILKGLTSEKVTFEAQTADQAQLSAGGAKFSLRLLPLGPYPKVEEITDPGINIPAADFLAAIKQVQPAASSDIQRGVLCGVLFESRPDGLRLVATDSYRLAVRDIAGATLLEEDQQVIVPAAAIADMARLFAGADTLDFRLSGKTLTVAAAKERLTTRLIEGVYHKYGILLEAPTLSEIVVDTAALHQAVATVRSVSSDSSMAAVINIKGDKTATVTARNAEADADVDFVVKSTTSAEDVTMAFNSVFLLAGLDAVGGTDVKIGYAGALKPVVLTSPENPSITYVVMPVRNT